MSWSSLEREAGAELRAQALEGGGGAGEMMGAGRPMGAGGLPLVGGPKLKG